ncbi:glycoside hydrolase family 57 protein [Candidatus Margulisiibacteriota bacterium]
MKTGYLSIVLHTHLPFVRHPEHEYFLEENWLYEAITETYIPLIDIFENLVKEKIDFRLTLSLTPTLISMLQDELLQKRYIRYIKNLIGLAEKELQRTKKYQPEMYGNAKMYYSHFKKCLDIFENDYQNDLTRAFKKYQDLGKIEIITSAATHGFLPLLQVNEKAVYVQIHTAVKQYKDVFGREPHGIWLPECGYYQGLEDVLRANGIKYFFVDTHSILFAEPRPVSSVYAPVYTNNGVAVFGRDPESSKSVWSSEEGYPGDYNYRDFYRDIGYDLSMRYIRPFIHPDGIRHFTGMKYYKITGNTTEKKPYRRKTALGRADVHAGNFLFNREKQVEYLGPYFKDKAPIVVCPYDSELFGHWWFEGPQFLDFLLRKAYLNKEGIQTITPSEYLKKYPKQQICQPSQSSWGYKGYSEVWLNEKNAWIYRFLHEISNKMQLLANKYKSSYNDISLLKKRALNQCVREVLLAQSSDWAFIMKTETVVEYAQKRTKEHISNFNKLYEQIIGDVLDESFIQELESKNNIFPNINYKIYAD